MAWVYNCTVKQAGVAQDRVNINIKGTGEDQSQVEGWFLTKPDMQKEMLAVALAAMNGEKFVDVGLEGDIAPTSPISYLYMKNS
jgi:hypothetical protein